MSDETILPTLSHGTLEIRDVQESLRFYRDFLHMKAVQHVPFGCCIWLREGWYIICLENNKAREMPLLNHFGIDVGSREEVDAWYERAVREQEHYGISKITSPRDIHDAYQFYLKDRDNNWWEIQYDAGNMARVRAAAGAAK
jgi:catechol 2,3-dioxygenase-like lactoylglutathione lyase family enzyme